MKKNYFFVFFAFTLTLFTSSTFAVENFLQLTHDAGKEIPSATNVGTKYQTTYTIKNISPIKGQSIQLSGFVASPSNIGLSVPTTFNTCLTSLPQGASCKFQIQYTPTKVGVFALNIGVNFLGDHYPSFVSLNTTTSNPGIVGKVISPLPGDVSVGQSQSTTVRFTNKGTTTRTISSVSLFTTPATTPNNFALQKNTCGSTLPGVNSGQDNYCEVTGTFAPTTTLVGDGRTATVTLTYDGSQTTPVPQVVDVHDAASALITSQLSGTTIPKDTTVGHHYEVTFDYTNTSASAAATINSVVPTTVPSSSTLSVKTNNCGSSLAPLATCSIVYNFDPTDAIVGSDRQLIFTLFYDSTKNNRQTITTSVDTISSPLVVGSAVNPLPTTTSVNTPVSTKVSFTNTGSVATTVNSIAAITDPASSTESPFIITSNDCKKKFTLQPNSANSCAVTAQFTAPNEFLNKKEIDTIIKLGYNNNQQHAKVTQATTVQESGAGIKAILFNYPISPFTPPACPVMAMNGVNLPLYVYKRDGTSGPFTQINYGIVSANSPAQDGFSCQAPSTYIKANGISETEIKFFALSSSGHGYKSCVIAVNTDGSIDTKNKNTTCFAVGVPTIRQQAVSIGLGQIFNGPNVGSDTPPSTPRNYIIPATRTIEIKNNTKYPKLCMNTNGNFGTNSARLAACTTTTPNSSGDVLINKGDSYKITIPKTGAYSIAMGVIGVELPGTSTLVNANYNKLYETAYQTNLEWTIFPDGPVDGSATRLNSIASTNIDVSGVNGTNIGVKLYPTTGDSSNFCANGPAVGYFDETHPLSEVTNNGSSIFDLCNHSALQPDAANPIACASPCAEATITRQDQNHKDLACCAGPFNTKSACDDPSSAVSDYTAAKYGSPPIKSTYTQNIHANTLSYYSYAYDDDGADYTCDPATSFVFDLITPGQ